VTRIQRERFESDEAYEAVKVRRRVVGSEVHRRSAVCQSTRFS
jgi:aspartate carbamoyltransferase catalytic subunit